MRLRASCSVGGNASALCAAPAISTSARKHGNARLRSATAVGGPFVLEADGGVHVEGGGPRGAVFDRLIERALLAQVERPGRFILARPQDEPARRLGTVDALEELPDCMPVSLHPATPPHPQPSRRRLWPPSPAARPSETGRSWQRSPSPAAFARG